MMMTPKMLNVQTKVSTLNTFKLILSMFFCHLHFFYNSGVPSDIQLSLETFKRALFNKEAPKVEVNSLLLNRQKEMTRVKFQKIGLTDVSLKYFIHEDLISGTPFKKDGKYL